MNKNIKHICTLSILFLAVIGMVATVSANDWSGTAEQFLGNLTSDNITSNSVITITESIANVSTNYTINASNITIQTAMDNKVVFYGISALNSSFINITGNNVTIRGITFANITNNINYFDSTHWDKPGGILLWIGDYGSIENCKFIDNTVTYAEGGALFWRGDYGNVFNCDFNACKAIDQSYGKGGAIYWTGEYGTIINSIFYNSTAYYEGAAIYLQGAYGTISNCKFSKCNNDISRSVVYFEISDYSRLSNCLFNDTFLKNYISFYESDDVILTNCSFTGSHSNHTLIIWRESDNGILANCSFYNISSDDVLIEYYDVKNITIVNCAFQNITRYDEGDGRGIYGAVIELDGNREGKIINCTFDRCTSTNLRKDCYGSALSGVDVEDLMIYDSKFTNCYSNKGGAIYFEYGWSIILFNSTFKNCTSQDGGAIYFCGVTEGNISDCDFMNCRADRGGAICLVKNSGFGDFSTLENNSFINCSAIEFNGASIYNDACIIFISGGDGTLIYNRGIIMNPINVVILDNKTVTVAKDSVFVLSAMLKTGNYTIIDNDFDFVVNNSTIKAHINNNYLTADYNVAGNSGDKILVNGSYSNGLYISYETAVLFIKNPVQISGGIITAQYSKKINITLNVTSNGAKVDYGTVNITIEGYGSDTWNVINGKVIITLNDLNPGIYSLKALYIENSVYLSGNSNISLIIITPTPSGFNLIGYDVYKEFENNTQYHAIVTDGAGSPLSNMFVLVSLSSSKWTKDVNYTIITNDEGVATLIINLLPGDYNITAHFADKIAINNITVLSVNYNLQADNVVKYFKNGTQYNVKVTDINDNPVVNRTVTITINKDSWKNPVKYYVKTNGDGIATLDINLIAGTYSVTANICYNSTKNTIVVLPILTADSITKKVSQSSNLKAKLVDGQGNPAIDKTVYFTVKTKTYTLTTNNEGIATLPIHLGLGTWSFLISSGDAQTRATVKVIK